MKKKIIIFDLDDTMLTGNFLKIANEVFNENKKLQDLTQYYLEDNFNITEEQKELFWDELTVRNVYENPTIIDGAYDTIKKLSKDFEIFVASASILKNREKQSANFFNTKFKCVVDNFDFINPNNIILTGKKSLICGDYMVDDKLENLVCNKKIKHKVLFTAYHNKNMDNKILVKQNLMRVEDYEQLYRYMYKKLKKQEVKNVINQILEYYFKRVVNYSFEINNEEILIAIDSKAVTKEENIFYCDNYKVKESILCNKIFKILGYKTKIEIR